MTEEEVIIVDDVADGDYTAIVQRAVEYAIISIPFTFNRMRIADLSHKIGNIAKGKVAEGLFQHYCFKHNLPADFNSCTTPFFKPDKRDFLLYGYEWDIKNNFLYHAEDFSPEYIKLPALIPKEYRSDQWDKRDLKMMNQSEGVRYLFTFLRNGDGFDKRSSFLSIHLNAHQTDLLNRACNHYSNNRILETAPFTEDLFWKKFYADDKDELPFTLHHHPKLVITGWAGAKQWPLFRDSGSDRRDYSGILRTRINNKFTEIENLPSFGMLLQILSGP